MTEMEENSTAELRFGSITALYYSVIGAKMPKQLDQLQTWFPDLVVQVDESDGRTKVPAKYEDSDRMIHAVMYHDTLYSGGSTKISQILGRLCGTAKGNKEKEKATAEEIQKRIAAQFATDMTLTPRLKENSVSLIRPMTDEQQAEFYSLLNEAIDQMNAGRKNMDSYDREHELFAMYDETFSGILSNAAKQLSLQTVSGLCNAYLWLLIGGLLREQSSRVLHIYDSYLMAANRQPVDTDDIDEQLNFLRHPEQYGYYFEGDEEDLKNRFPDIWWTCNGCGDLLNHQKGFDDHLPEWKCTKCGYVNKLDYSEIYENEEDARHHVNPCDPRKFEEALQLRRMELNKK